VFLDYAKPFTMTLQGVAAPPKAEWYEPLTGRRADAGTVGNGATELKPPSEWGNGMVALHVGTRRE
jgi:hypothetical protein